MGIRGLLSIKNKDRNRSVMDALQNENANIVIICNKHSDVRDIIYNVHNKSSNIGKEMINYGSQKILVTNIHNNFSSLTVITKDEVHHLRGATYNALLFTNDIEYDIKNNIIKYLYPQLPKVGGFIGKFNLKG